MARTLFLLTAATAIDAICLRANWNALRRGYILSHASFRREPVSRSRAEQPRAFWSHVAGNFALAAVALAVAVASLADLATGRDLL